MVGFIPSLLPISLTNRLNHPFSSQSHNISIIIMIHWLNPHYYGYARQFRLHFGLRWNYYMTHGLNVSKSNLGDIRYPLVNYHRYGKSLSFYRLNHLLLWSIFSSIFHGKLLVKTAGSFCQWIGLGENLQENPTFHGKKTMGFRFKFSQQNQSIDIKHSNGKWPFIVDFPLLLGHGPFVI